MNSRDALNLSIEPDAIRQLTPEQKDRLTDLLDRYFSQLEKGLPPSREYLLESNADLAGPLRAYFDSLDELHDMAAGFQQPAVDAGGDEAMPAGDERRLGDFRLLREIGRGGMGVVYEAEQISLGRRVAVKVLPFAAVLDSRQIARFKHEAQAAAQLNHPNIVSVFAVGVERGVHFYAMQLIDGQPLDRALAELREKYPRAERAGQAKTPPQASSRPNATALDHTAGLVPQESECPAGRSVKSTHTGGASGTLAAGHNGRGSLLTSRGEGGGYYFRAVMQLGIEAAGALHAAHENGIVHRDIKPSNLLLDGNGKVWVTDFGLARRETNPTLTRNGDLVGTLRYMSPEQALGQVALIDHRTDIYSLGATLYELLTLEPAFGDDAGPALLRHIERNEPRPLRQLQPKVPADLETVILKGMAKRREDRYASAQEFADDLERVMDGKPIVARPPSLLDRATRWAQRHREVVAVAGLFGLLALVGLTASTLLIAAAMTKTTESLDLAEKSRDLAEKRFRDAHDAVEKMGLRISERLTHVPGAGAVRQDLLHRTVGYYRDFVEQAKDKPELRADLAWTYGKIGKLYAEIGSNADATEADQQAIRLYQELAGAKPAAVDVRRQLGVCKNNLALVLERAGKTEEARKAFAEAISLQEESLSKADDPNNCRADLASACSSFGLLQSKTGDARSAAASISRAVKLQQQVLDAEPDDPERLCQLAKTLINLGALYADHQPIKASEQYEKAAAAQKRALELRPNDAVFLSDMVLAYNNLGMAQSRLGAVIQAAETYDKVLDLAGELLRQSPSQKSYIYLRAIGFNNLGQVHNRMKGQAAKAESDFRKAMALQETLVKQDPADVECQSALGTIYNNLGTVLQETKRPEDAVQAYAQAVAHQRVAQASAPEVARYRQLLSMHYINYGRTLRLIGRPGDAVHADLARRQLWPNDPQNLVSVAEDLALDARDLARNGFASDVNADACGAYAVETLKLATAAGWKPDPNSNWTKRFLAIKNRADFVALTKN